LECRKASKAKGPLDGREIQKWVNLREAGGQPTAARKAIPHSAEFLIFSGLEAG
jgi:hypothetical protein